MDQNKIENFYTYLESQQTSQRYLYHCYQKIADTNAEVKSYENCNAFLYYLEHAKKYYDAGKKGEVTLKPVLLYYGMVHLLKACLLTIRPDYPESTTLLAHGVSTRKRKKKNYSFLKDEVKVQHNGLFPYFSNHLYGITSMPIEKITMETLLGLIPEMNDVFSFHQQNKLDKIGEIQSNVLCIPTRLLDNYHLTLNAFIRKIESYLPEIESISHEDNRIKIYLAEPLQDITGPFYLHTDQSVYFPVLRDNFLVIPEVMNHYLVLYNLSMISRYESEWWGELLYSKAEIDYPLIYSFLKVTEEKIPLLLGEKLLNG